MRMAWTLAGGLVATLVGVGLAIGTAPSCANTGTGGVATPTNDLQVNILSPMPGCVQVPPGPDPVIPVLVGVCPRGSEADASCADLGTFVLRPPGTCTQTVQCGHLVLHVRSTTRTRRPDA